MGPGEHRRPGVEGGAQSDRVLLVWNVTIPLGFDGGNAVDRLTVRKVGFSSGRRMTQEANAGGRKAAGRRGERTGSSVGGCA